MVNLQLIDGISFKKGCFPGQEIVARMKYLGKLKRRMYPRPNCLLANTLSQAATFSRTGGNASAGKIIDARVDTEGTYPCTNVAENRHRRSWQPASQASA